MRVEELTRQVLILLGNNHTKVKMSSNYNFNYYNFLTDTIHLTTNVNKQKQARGLEKANPFCGNLVTICHECIHSVQSINLHWINLVLSNLSIILTVIALILIAITSKPLWFLIISTVLIAGNIIIRLVLEIQAIMGSLTLTKQAIEKLNIETVQIDDINQAKRIIKRLMPVQIIRMVWDKIIMLIIVVI